MPRKRRKPEAPKAAPFIVGVAWPEEAAHAKARFIFRFGGARPPERRPPGQALPGPEEEAPAEDLDGFFKYIDRVESELLSKAVDDRERAAVKASFNTIRYHARARLEEGMDPNDIAMRYLPSVDTAAGFFKAVWARRGRVRPLVTSKVTESGCVAASSPIMAAQGCVELRLCHEQGIYSIDYTPLDRSECQLVGDKEGVFRQYRDRVQETIRRLRSRARAPSDREVLAGIERDFIAAGERLILGARDARQANARARTLLDRLKTNIVPAILEAWSRGASLRRGGCRYRTTTFMLSPPGSEITTFAYYEFCPDNQGILKAERRIVRERGGVVGPL